MQELRASYGPKVFFMQASCCIPALPDVRRELTAAFQPGNTAESVSSRVFKNHFQPLQTACECFPSPFDAVEYHGLAL